MAIFAASCKKEAQFPQQQLTVIDYDTRQGINNVAINSFKQEFFDVFIGMGYYMVPIQSLHTGPDGKATLSLGEAFGASFSADGYLSRNLEMRYAKGDIEMLKSAAIELTCVNANLTPGSIIYIDINSKPELQLGRMQAEETVSFSKVIDPSADPQIFSFQGAADKLNNLSISISTLLDSGTVVKKDTVIQATPSLASTTHIEFKY